MSKQSVAANLILVGLAVFLAIWLVRDLTTSRPLPPVPAPRAQSGPPVGQDPAADPAAGDKLAVYNVIVAKYLFNPSRSEGVPVAATPGPPPPPPPPKPTLLGVVVDGGESRAYLEDATTKRVFGYQVGDTVAGGRLEKITQDRVLISRPDGQVDVLLHDPTKPKPAAAPVPGAPPVAPGAGQPARPIPPGTTGAQSGVETPQSPRPIPPRAVRRMPQGTGTGEQEAEQQ